MEVSAMSGWNGVAEAPISGSALAITNGAMRGRFGVGARNGGGMAGTQAVRLKRRSPKRKRLNVGTCERFNVLLRTGSLPAIHASVLSKCILQHLKIRWLTE